MYQRPAAAQLEHLEAPTAATALAIAVLTACWKLWAMVVTDVDAVPTANMVKVSNAAAECDLIMVHGFLRSCKTYFWSSVFSNKHP